MIKRKLTLGNILIALGIGLIALTLFAGFRIWSVLASEPYYEPDLVNICHQTGSEYNPWEAISVAEPSLPAHFSHGDFYYEGPTDEDGFPDEDGDEWCEEEQPEPSPTPSPTPEPEDVCPNLDGIQESLPEGYHFEEVWEEYNGNGYETEIICVPDEQEPTPSPSPTPTTQPESPRSDPGPASAPSCPDSTPPGVANIFVDSGDPNDGKLEVRWTSNEPKGNKAHIRYSEEDGNWRYSLLNTDNDGREEIGGLANGTHYWFQVAQVNGCAVGPWSSSFDPLP